MKKLYNLVAKLYDTEVPAQGLAVFRITYCVILFMEIAQLDYFSHLILYSVPFIKVAEATIDITSKLWLVVIFFLAIGLFTRTMAVVNYCFTLFTIAVFHKFEYHVDYSMISLNFLFMFIPIGRAFSIDRLFEKLKYSTLKIPYRPPVNVSVLNYYIIVGMVIGLVYFDSMFYKLASPMWLKGLGFWWPTSLPFATYLDLSFILNSKILSYTLGFVTLVFEGVFLFFIWNKKFRIPLIIVGVGLHLGILVAYPIPWFALAAAGIYILLLPYDLWSRMHNKVKADSATLTVYYDEECPLCYRIKIIVSHFDFFGKIQFKGIQTYASSEEALKNVEANTLLANIYSVNSNSVVYFGVATYIQIFSRIWFLWPVSILLRLPLVSHLANKIYASVAQNRFREVCNEENCAVEFPAEPPVYDKIKILTNLSVKDLKVGVVFVFILYCLFLQSLCISQSLLSQAILKTIHLNTYVNVVARRLQPFLSTNTKFIGITRHPVFMDKVHFNGYHHIIAITYTNPTGEEEWLPLNDKNGQAGLYNTGREWIGWTFRSNSRNIKVDDLHDGMQRYTAFWANKHNVSLVENAKFKVKVKKIAEPTGWEENFLRNQMAKPWQDVGEIVWEQNKCAITIPDIESL